MLKTHTIFDASLEKGSKKTTRRVTDMKEAIRDKNRINIYLDDKFFCSLDISQVVNFHLKIGKELSEDELAELKAASDFGKFYARALEYVLMRPRTEKELSDYLKRKTTTRKVRVKNRKTGEYSVEERKGYDKSLIAPVLQRLSERGYVDDRRFAELWVENRNVSKGTSVKKLRLELQQKGVSEEIIEQTLANSGRDERDELRIVIARKAKKYPDRNKLIQYLLRQGFNYSDISDELSSSIDSSSE